MIIKHQNLLIKFPTQVSSKTSRKSKLKLAFAALEKEMEVVSKEEQHAYLGGVGSTGGIVRVFVSTGSDSTMSGFQASIKSNFDAAGEAVDASFEATQLEDEDEYFSWGTSSDFDVWRDNMDSQFAALDERQDYIPTISPYVAFNDTSLDYKDPAGDIDYPIYSKSGSYLGDDGRIGGDLAFTGELDGKGGFKNLSQFTKNHTQFQTISNIVKHEGVTKDAKEYLWIAHTANNAANRKGKSLYSILMSGFSSVEKSDKTALSISDNSTTAIFARAGVINVMSGGADPTGGATLWDGTDFLSWGLKSPDGTPHNKFEEYKSISISGDIYSDFLNGQLSKFPKGKVKYSGLFYNLPSDVFTDDVNWGKGGNFFYNTGEDQPYGLKATGTAGLSIFWKMEK